MKLTHVVSSVLAPVSLLLIALAARLPALTAMPLHTDEGNDVLYKAIMLQQTLFTQQPLDPYWLQLAGVPLISRDGRTMPLFYVLASCCISFTTNPVLIVRLPALALGTSAIIALYYASAGWLQPGFAWLISLGAALLPWHIASSINGISAAGHLLFFPLTLLGYNLAVKSRSRGFLFLFAVYLGAVAIAYHGLGLLLPIIFGPALLRHPVWREQRGTWLLPAFGILLSWLPLGFLIVLHPSPGFGAHLWRQSLLSQSNASSLPLTFVTSLGRAGRRLFFARVNVTMAAKLIAGPLLGYAGALLAAAGMIQLFTHVRPRARRLILWWLATTLVIGGGLSRDPYPRYLLPALCPLLLLMGYGLQSGAALLARGPTPKKRAVRLGLGMALLVCYVIPAVNYTLRQPSQAELIGARYGGKEVAAMIGELYAGKHFLFVDCYRMTSSYYLWSFAQSRGLQFTFWDEGTFQAQLPSITAISQIDEILNADDMYRVLSEAQQHFSEIYCALWHPSQVGAFYGDDVRLTRYKALYRHVERSYRLVGEIALSGREPIIDVFRYDGALQSIKSAGSE